MVKKIIIFPFIIFAISLATFGLYRHYITQPQPEINKAQVKKSNSYRIGEEIIYDVRLGGLRVGQAKFNNVEMTKINAVEANLVTFETRVPRFTDLERIYSIPDSFLPLRVERNISMWPVREQIIEEYDQKNFTVNINKRKFGKESNTLIKKERPINNAVLLPYYVRNIPDPHIGWSLDVSLPTQDFTIKLVSREELEIPAGKFVTYRFESIPKKFEIWISADNRRIPVKIKGVNKLGYTLLMKVYNYKSKEGNL